MKHATEEQLVDAYYGEPDSEVLRHTRECKECRALLERITEMLNSVREYRTPERGADYGRQVWIRLLPKLPPAKTHSRFLRWWTMAPVAAALVVIAFVAGMFTEHRRGGGIPQKARERVLLISLSDHLQRSELELTEVMNASPGTLDWREQRERARDLVAENRLLRETALRGGDMEDAAVLSELERVLLEIANGPAEASAADLDYLQQRIQQNGLLFKVRVTSVDARRKGQEL